MINFSFLSEQDRNFNTKISSLLKIIGKNQLLKNNSHVLMIKEWKFLSNINLYHKIFPKNLINFLKNRLQYLKIN